MADSLCEKGLEAALRGYRLGWNERHIDCLAAAIRAYLAATSAGEVSEPVAWRYRDFAEGWIYTTEINEEYARLTGVHYEPLYAAPPALAAPVTAPPQPAPHADLVEPPIIPLMSDNGEPAWLQIDALFHRHNCQNPGWRVRDELVAMFTWAQYGKAIAALSAVPREASPTTWPTGARYHPGDRVTKIRGSKWTGPVCGFYSTALTPIGYCVESENEPGSVQVWPDAALSSAPTGGE